MAHSDVWFILPSANPTNCAANLPLWRDQGYRVAVLQDRERFECDADVVVHADAYPGWPGTVNRLFREVVPDACPVVVSGGDDMRPDPSLRAGEIAEQFLDHFGGTFGVMQPHGDAFEDTKQFCGSPWLGREWMRRMYGGAGGMCSAYTHHWADDELYWVSRCLGALWSRDDLTQYHDHFRRRGESAPDYWRESVLGADEHDTLMFLVRSKRGFPGHAPVGLDRRFDQDLFRAEYSGRAERYWRMFHSSVAGLEDPSRRLSGALERCEERGWNRVAIYGAGQHTRKASLALCTPPVEVVGIIDDNPSVVGRTMWNIPVIDAGAAVRAGVRAVILSSDAMEDRLWDSALPLRNAGIPVIRLYEGETGADAEVA